MTADKLRFPALIKSIESDLGRTEWVTVFEFFGSREDNDSGTYFTALVANKKVKTVLESYEWDMQISDGRPGFIEHSVKGRWVRKYYRYSDPGIEQLVYWRSFPGRKETYIEVSEEFRLYFNLFEETRSGNGKKYIYTNEDGDEDVVLVVDENKAQIKLKYLKEFLAAKKMHLAIYFEAMCFLEKPLQELGVAGLNTVKKGDDYIYSLCVRNLSLTKTQSQGWLLGKKLISGSKTLSPTLWRSKQNDQFEKFIIGVDSEGQEITYSCNTEYKANPGFLTPVFFRREVLKKYYDNPDQYTVEDGSVSRNGFWNLRIMNNHSDHVVAWLGDLKDLPYKEQSHWRSFNVTPSNRKISHTDFARNIHGQFADPEHPELFFKYTFTCFNAAWHEKYKWDLFVPLSIEDTHHVKSLHIPTTNDQKEFDDQVASITKILIDSLNGTELARGLIIDKPEPKSIDKLEAFIISHGLSYPTMISFLRNLQALRSTGVAHRKGANYQKAFESINPDEKDLRSTFEDILTKCIWMLNTLESKFIRKTEK